MPAEDLFQFVDVDAFCFQFFLVGVEESALRFGDVGHLLARVRLEGLLRLDGVFFRRLHAAGWQPFLPLGIALLPLLVAAARTNRIGGRLFGEGGEGSLAVSVWLATSARDECGDRLPC